MLKNKIIFSWKNINYELVTPIILGIAAFFLICGSRILNPQNIAWLANGDPAQHYLGWVFFRNSEWTFPIIGLNPNFGLEISSSIVFSDSNPLFAILFKLLSPILPKTFQYFGLWILLCFILQAVASYRLVSLISNNKIVNNLSVLLFLFSPPFLFRLHEHVNLVAHFTILFAIYFVFSKNLKKYYWILLLNIAILTHFYLFVMAFVLFIFDLFNKCFIHNKVSVKIISIYTFITLILLLTIAYIIGYFTDNVNVFDGGFGVFKTNVLSIIDSGTVSVLSTQWSYIIKDIPVPAGSDFEGFNFLGSGILFIIIVSTILIINNYNDIFLKIKQYKWLILLCLTIFMFALSNSIAIATYEFNYYLPSSVLKFANILRASGRFFWVIFYIIIFSFLYILINYTNKKTILIILSLAVIIQILDTSIGWMQIRKKLMIKSKDYWVTRLNNSFWADIPKHYTKLRHIPLINYTKNWSTLSYYSANNNLKTDAVYLARAQGKIFFKAVKSTEQVIQNGSFATDSIYILDDENYDKALKFRENNKNITKYHLYTKIDGFNVIAPNWFLYKKY